MRRALVIALALTTLTWAVPARADDPGAGVRRRLIDGEKDFADQDYRAAVEAFSQVVGDPVATRDQRARAFEYLGMSYLILGRPKKARESFEELLAIDPHYTLSDPSQSPKLREFYDEVRAGFVPGFASGAAEAELEHSAPTGATAGRRLEIDVRVVRGAELVREMTLHTRRQGQATYTEERLRGEGGNYLLRFVPAHETSDYVLEYYLEALDDGGRVVGRVGSPLRPLTLGVRGVPPPPPAPTAWYKRWYVWGAIGAVVAGAAVGVTIALTAAHAPSGTLPPGQVSLGLRF